MRLQTFACARHTAYSSGRNDPGFRGGGNALSATDFTPGTIVTERLEYVAMTVRISFRSTRAGRLIANICWKLRVAFAILGSAITCGGTILSLSGSGNCPCGLREYASGSCDKGEEGRPPPLTNNHVKVPVTTSNAINKTPEVVLHGNIDLRRFPLRREAQFGIPEVEGVR